MTPLLLFRGGLDTVEIARRLRISEAHALRRIHEERCRELKAPCLMEASHSARKGSAVHWGRAS